MRKYTLILSLVSAMSLPAAADGLYVFGDVGQSQFSGELSQTDKAFALGFGYSLNSTFSIEMAYHDLGGFDTTEALFAPALGMGYIYVYNSVDVTAYSLSAVAKLPVSEKFDLYGRLGYSHLSSDSSGSLPASFSDSESKATYGVGAAYKVNEKFALRAEYVKFGDLDLSSLTVGGTYSF